MHIFLRKIYTSGRFCLHFGLVLVRFEIVLKSSLAFLLTGELWTERVMLYYVENVPGAWLQKENIKSVVIDETLGFH